MDDLELALVGLLMAASLYCDGPQQDDPTEDFSLWRDSWRALGPAWHDESVRLGWKSVGACWKYHPEW